MLKLMFSHRCLCYFAECLHSDTNSIGLNVIAKQAYSTLMKQTFSLPKKNSCCGNTKCFYAKKKQYFKRHHVYNEKEFIQNIMSEIEQPESKFTSGGGQLKISPVVSEDNSFSDVEVLGRSKSGFAEKLPTDFRLWETMEGKKKTNIELGNTVKFKVVSYNVLAQYLLESHPYLYTECPSRALKWSNRGPLLFEEITYLSPDILCLQEVQASHIPTFYSKLEELGYEAVFKQKTGYRRDGCAIYFKQSMFEIKDHMSVEFYQPELPILNRDNIGLMVQLAPRLMPSQSLVVATTHLLYNPKRSDVRLAQMKLFLAEIDRFCCQNRSKGAERMPVILTGDLNSSPDSAVIQLLSNGNISTEKLKDNSDWRKIAVTDHCQHFDSSNIKIQNSELGSFEQSTEKGLEYTEEHSALFNSGHLTHDLGLKSVYNFMKENGEPEATTFQDEWCTVDYIFYSENAGLIPLDRYRLPTSEQCGILGSLPNDHLPSDHLVLGATFLLEPPQCSL